MRSASCAASWCIQLAADTAWSVQVLYGFLFGWLLFGESLSLLSVLGSILIAGGIIASSLTKSKPASEPPDKQVGSCAQGPQSMHGQAFDFRATAGRWIVCVSRAAHGGCPYPMGAMRTLSMCHAPQQPGMKVQA